MTTDNLKPGDKITVQLNDGTMYTDIITQIKHESPLFNPPVRPSLWRRAMIWLGFVAPTPTPAVLPSVRVIGGGIEDELARMRAVHSTCYRTAIAAIEADE